MTVPSRSSTTPSVEEISTTLSALCTRGLRSWWVIDIGRPLMALDCVRECLKPNAADERDYALALRAYLEKALTDVRSLQHRIILEVVLGLGAKDWKTDDWRSKSAKTRRAEAGRLFRGGEQPVAEGTIRQVYEPRARAELASIIWRDEKLARGESPEQTDGQTA